MGVEVGGGGGRWEVGGGRWEVGGIRWIQVEVILLPLNVINKRGATHDVLSIFVYILVNKREGGRESKGGYLLCHSNSYSETEGQDIV